MQEQLKKYEVWIEEDQSAASIALSTPENIEQQRIKGLLSPNARLMHVITAASFEEAKSIFNLRMGFEPYQPEGEAQMCPYGCGSYFYPKGSGECPYCGVRNNKA